MAYKITAVLCAVLLAASAVSARSLRQADSSTTDGSTSTDTSGSNSTDTSGSVSGNATQSDVSQAISAIGEALKAYGDQIPKDIADQYNQLQELSKNLTAANLAAIQTISAKIVDSLKEQRAALQAGIESVANRTREGIEAGLTRIQNATQQLQERVEQAQGAVKDKLQGIGANIGQGIQNATNAFNEFNSNLQNRTSAAITNAIQQQQQAAGTFVNGLTSTIAAGRNLTSEITKLFNPITYLGGRSGSSSGSGILGILG